MGAFSLIVVINLLNRDKHDKINADITVSADLLKKTGVTVWAIGMAEDAQREQLEIIASKPEYVRVYKNQSEFKKDIACVLYETCMLTLDMDNPEGSGGKPSDIKSWEFTLRAMTPGEWRYFQ